jgi:putative ABC transport system substrate-binding protein
MKRGEFIKLLGAAAATAMVGPSLVCAQESTLPVVGILDSKLADGAAHFVAAFRQGLQEAGYVEGRNVRLDFRFAEGQYERLPMMATDLVRTEVNVIAAISPFAALAARDATKTIPIVFQSGSDPIEAGLVANLNRPGGNLTGFYRFADDLVPKCLELLREAVPTATTMGLLMNAAIPTAEARTRDAEAAAKLLGLKQLHLLNAANEREIEVAFDAAVKQGVGAVAIGQDAFSNSHTQQLAALASRHRLPAIFSLREFATAGGLMSYGASLADQYRQVGLYTGRILKGEKPADLPVQQSTNVELIVNLKTAKALGLTVPLSLLGRADEVIE